MTPLQDTKRAGTAPAKRWRNWWRLNTTTHLKCSRCGMGRDLVAGDLWDNCCYVYPSKDFAETAATELWLKVPPRDPWITYIEALPEGERP